MGYIEIITGPMGSGKSEKLISLYHSTEEPKIALTSIMDTRNPLGRICSRNGDSIPAMAISTVDDHLLEYLRLFKGVFIDEAQFIKNITRLDILANEGIVVYLSGIVSSYERGPIGTLLDMIPLAEKITQLYSICFMCSERASFTLLEIDAQSIDCIHIGNEYKPVCRKCYNSINIFNK